MKTYTNGKWKGINRKNYPKRRSKAQKIPAPEPPLSQRRAALPPRATPPSDWKSGDRRRCPRPWEILYRCLSIARRLSLSPQYLMIHRTSSSKFHSSLSPPSSDRISSTRSEVNTKRVRVCVCVCVSVSLRCCDAFAE